MDDIISRSAFAEEVESLEITVAGKPARWHDAKHTVLRRIAEAPAVDAVEVVHSEWEQDGIADRCKRCKACIVVEQGTAEMNYCPNCGARMDGDRNAAD